MSRLAYENFRNWTVDEVSTWLGEIHLSNHIHSFERNAVTGVRLTELSDKEIREQLGVVKPSEFMVLKGAISNLIKHTNVSGSKISKARSTRDRTGSFEKRLVSPGTGMEHRTQTLPHTINHSVGIKISVEKQNVSVQQPVLKVGSAQELLDDRCRFSGWIRKQGGGHKSWKRRYLILRIGWLYYFSNETASSPKGKFVLSGYKVTVCREPDIVKKYKHVLKLTPMNPQVRTYFIAFGSKGELERWQHELNEEINNMFQSVNVPSATVMPYGEEEELEDDMVENIYDDPEGEVEEEDDYTPVTLGEEAIYDKPEDFEDDSDHYSRVEESLLLPGTKPVVPIRSRVSLQPDPATVHKFIKIPSAPSSPDIKDSDSVENDDIYLPIVDSTSVVESVMADSGQEKSSPLRGDNNAVNPSPSAKEDTEYVDPSDEEDGSGYDSDDDGGGYYIMFRKPDELMPQSCQFDRLERADADKLLRSLNRDGTYLIRGGSHAGADKVLSVWHIDRCRHYKLFKDESFYSLTQGQRFRTMPELLQYYTLQSHLPRSDFYLSDPYHPDDH